MEFGSLIKHLKVEEGFSSAPYKDTKGLWTIGYGTLIDEQGGGITQAEAAFLLNSRVQVKYAELDNALSWFQDMPEVVQFAMTAMAYQMGADGFLKFKKTLLFLKAESFESASDEALDSKWAKEDSPARAKRVTDMIRSAADV